jgi:signal transduction histidine kinase
MVQRAVLEADGSVAVHSVLGSGTTFTLTLPRLR